MGMRQYTAAEVAKLTGRVDRTIRQLAEANGIGRKFGHVWVFTDADIAKFKAIYRGPKRKPRRGKAVAYTPSESTPTPQEPTP